MIQINLLYNLQDFIIYDISYSLCGQKIIYYIFMIIAEKLHLLIIKIYCFLVNSIPLRVGRKYFKFSQSRVMVLWICLVIITVSIIHFKCHCSSKLFLKDKHCWFNCLSLVYHGFCEDLSFLNHILRSN